MGRSSVRIRPSGSVRIRPSGSVRIRPFRGQGGTGSPPIEGRIRSLPTPPSDEEKYRHLAPRRPWVLYVQLAAITAVSWSTVRFVLDIPFAGLLLLPLGVSILGAVLSFVTTLPGGRDDWWTHDVRAALHHPWSWPSVDVFLPSCGEDVEVIRNTFHWVSRLAWPGRLAVHVLDDSGRDEIRALATEHGFEYHCRPDRGHLKKAGNLAYGFEHTTGDLIVVFDADFCPRSDFLTELAPYFRESDVGIVQSPQYFDIDDRMNWVQQSAAASQEYFYRWVQPARDRADGAICVGTNAIYRRAALERSGGFAHIDHSEDVYTGVNLTRVGFRTRYVPVILAKGLCPDDVDQFISQQYRWCAGSLSLLFSREFHRTPMSLFQRMCFWAGFLYYLSTALDLILAATPTVLLGVFGPERLRPENYLLLSAAVIGWLVVQPVVTGGRGHRLWLARTQLLCSFAHLQALWDLLRNRPASWVPTGTGTPRSAPLPVKVRTVIMRYFLLVEASLVGVLLWRAPEFGWDVYWPVAVLAVGMYLVFGPLLRSGLGAVRPSFVSVHPYRLVRSSLAPVRMIAQRRHDARVGAREVGRP
jgi:cellulose synthase/poly-beta-1,6-N-acetylglucosamine synthase-like glycosyltransferase